MPEATGLGEITIRENNESCIHLATRSWNTNWHLGLGIHAETKSMDLGSSPGEWQEGVDGECCQPLNMKYSIDLCISLLQMDQTSKASPNSDNRATWTRKLGISELTQIVREGSIANCSLRRREHGLATYGAFKYL